MTYTIGSLFSGAIDGLAIAAVMAGFEVAFHVEFDDWRREQLNYHGKFLWPKAQSFKDVKAVGAHNLPPVRGLVGGFPCQDVSVAGDRRGLAEGTRSGLWWEFARIVGELRPGFVVIENTAGLRSLGLSTVINDLARLGYVGQWGRIFAGDVGAPHRRERVFVVAYDGTQRRTEYDVPALRGEMVLGDRCADATRQPERLSESGLGRSAYGSASGVQFPAGMGTYQHPHEAPRSISQRTPEMRRRIAALGDAVVWQAAYPVFALLMERLQLEAAA